MDNTYQTVFSVVFSVEKIGFLVWKYQIEVIRKDEPHRRRTVYENTAYSRKSAVRRAERKHQKLREDLIRTDLVKEVP